MPDETDDYIEIDFEKKAIKGKTTKGNIKKQFQMLKETLVGG